MAQTTGIQTESRTAQRPLGEQPFTLYLLPFTFYLLPFTLYPPSPPPLHPAQMNRIDIHHQGISDHIQRNGDLIFALSFD